MEDDESGSSSFNSSDGGSGSWSPSSSHKTNQHVPSREGGYGRMEPRQLLSNDFYIRQFSRQRPEESDESFEEESDEEGDEIEVQRREHGHAPVDGEEDGSESDYDGFYEEPQLLEQYNAAHYSKIDHEEKLRCKGALDLPHSIGNNRQRLGGKQDNHEESQLHQNYDSSYYCNVPVKGKLMQLPLNVVTDEDHSKDLKSLEHERTGSGAELACGAEPTEPVDSEASTEVEATTPRQDQQEAPYKEKPNSEFRQERMFGFDMDLNVRLEDEMDCEYYGEPRNHSSQLVSNTETQLVDEFRGWQRDTQLVSTTGKDFLDNITSSQIKVVTADAKEMPCETRGGIGSNNLGCNTECKEALQSKSREIFGPVSTEGIQIFKQSAVTKTSSSSILELPSLTTESKLLAVPSASEASEGSPFQCSVGTIHAESIRLAAMQPLMWLPKLKLEDHNFCSSQSLKRESGMSVNKVELPSNEPQWMRDYGGRGDILANRNWDETVGAPGSSSEAPVQVSSFSIDSKLPGMLTSGQKEMGEQGAISRQAGFPGMRSLFGSSNMPSANYTGTISNLGYEGRNSQTKTQLQRRISFGPRLSSPTGSLNYLDSVEPGEDVQAQALDMVDKLVWLNTADAPHTSPPRKYKKSFSGLPPAISPLTNPALQVFEFEDTPSAQRPQTYGDLSLIKEIQAGWKKKAEQGHLALTAKKGKEKETAVLPEGERLSKLLTEKDRDKICEPRLVLNAASTKRISAKLDDKGEACLDTATRKSSASDSAVVQERVSGCRSENVANETKGLKGNLAEPVEVTDDDLLNVVVKGMQKLSNTSGLRSDKLMEHNRDQEAGEEKVLDVAQTLTRRRSQGRNRREHIRVPEAVLLSGNHSSPEGTLRKDCETQQNPSTAQKRRSLNYMLRDRSTKKARSMVEEDFEDQNEANENMSILSSPTSSGADPMFVVPDNPSSSRRKTTPDITDKDEENAVVESEKPAKGKKRRRISEASRLLEEIDIGDMRSEDGVKTRSLRQLRRRCNDDNRTEPFSSGLVQKRLRSVRRGSGGGQGAPKISIIGDECDPHNGIELDASTSAWSASFQGDSDDDGLEVNDASSLGELEETSDQGASHIDQPVEDADLGRMKVKRTRSIADVSSPSTPVLQSAPFPLVTGRRGRGAVVKPEIIEEANLHNLYPSFVVPAAGKGTRMRTVRRRRDPQMLALTSDNALELIQEGSASVSTEGSLRTRRGTNVSVLFSHGLSEDTVKKQRKIVEKLDGKVTKKAADCTHFVAEKFVRTGNMLEAMAGGKFVVTFAWLESCRMANCFIEERNFILQDEKKERELGFSMRATILAAQHKPLLQAVRVLLTPNINPKPEAIAAIVHAAGGQVVEDYEGPAPDSQNEDFCVVIANEDDIDICVPFLEQGAKVYTSELILSGVISHHLEFSKHILFENYRGGRSRGGALRQT